MYRNWYAHFMTRSTRRPAEDIRRAIVEAAVRVVGERGVDGLTHRAVAEAADVSLSSTTYHFASKSMIVAAALQHLVDLDLQRLAEATDAVSATLAASGSVTVEALVDVLAREITDGEPGRLRARYHLQLEAAEHPELRPLLRTWLEATVQRLAAVLATLGSPAPEMDARLLVAAADGLRLGAFTTPEHVDDGSVLRPALGRMISVVTDLAN